jgi:hypothetical protein
MIRCVKCNKIVWPWQRIRIIEGGGKFAGITHRKCVFYLGGSWSYKHK